MCKIFKFYRLQTCFQYLMSIPSQADASIKLYEHNDLYLLCANMHVLQETAAAFDQWHSIKSKKKLSA